LGPVRAVFLSEFEYYSVREYKKYIKRRTIILISGCTMRYQKLSEFEWGRIIMVHSISILCFGLGIVAIIHGIISLAIILFFFGGFWAYVGIMILIAEKNTPVIDE